MTAVHDRTPYFESQSTTRRVHSRASESSVLMAAAVMTALLAVVVGVVAAYLVFPEPTMWRIAVNVLVIALAVHPIRALLRRAPAHADGRATAEDESGI